MKGIDNGLCTELTEYELKNFMQPDYIKSKPSPEKNDSQIRYCKQKQLLSDLGHKLSYQSLQRERLPNLDTMREAHRTSNLGDK
jgi:hypothetical protein